MYQLSYGGTGYLLINFFHCWSSRTSWPSPWSTSRHSPSRHSSRSSSRHSPRHSSWHSTFLSCCLLIKFGNDWITNTFCFFLFVFVLINFSGLIVIQPTNDFIAFIHNSFTIRIWDFVFQFFIVNGGFHVETIRF